MKYKLLKLFTIMTIISAHAQNDLNVLNDDFDNQESLQNWNQHSEVEGWNSFTDSLKIVNDKNVLYIEPQSSGWYNEFHRGPFLYKNIKENFTIVTKIKVTGKHTSSPIRSYSLAGLMVRAPRDIKADKFEKGFENWMFLSTGSATKKGEPQFETKNTVKGKSKLKVFSAKPGWIYLAIARKDGRFYQFYKYEMDLAWTLLRVIDRDDMPNELQVGILAYTDFWSVAFKHMFNARKFNTKFVKGKPDLKAYFDLVHFERISNALPSVLTEGYYNEKISKNEVILFGLDKY